MKDRTPEDIAGEALEGIRRRSRHSVYPNFSRTPPQTPSDAIVKREIPVTSKQKGSNMSPSARKGLRLLVVFVGIFILYTCITLVQDWLGDRRLARKIRSAQADSTISQIAASTPNVEGRGDNKPVPPPQGNTSQSNIQTRVALKSPYTHTAKDVGMSACGGSQSPPQQTPVFTQGLKATPGCAWVEVNYEYGVFMVQVVGGGSIEFPYQKNILGVDKCYDPSECITLLNHIRKNPKITDKRVLLRVENNVAGTGYTSGFLHIF